MEGKKYIDCYSSGCSANHGHCHPKIRDAMIKQASKLTLTSRAFQNDRFAPFQKKICELLGFDKVSTMTPGNEAMETAIKFARRWGYEAKGIKKDTAKIVFSSTKWGTTVTGLACYPNPDSLGYGPFKGFGFETMEFNNIDALQARFEKS